MDQSESSRLPKSKIGGNQSREAQKKSSTERNKGRQRKKARKQVASSLHEEEQETCHSAGDEET